jgi:hypothetical protein
MTSARSILTQVSKASSQVFTNIDMSEPVRQSSLVTPERANELAVAAIVKTFGNRDRESRMATIRSLYTPDFIVYEPEDTVLRGAKELDDVVESLLDRRQGWELIPTSEGLKGSTKRGVRICGDSITVEWAFGPMKENGEQDVKITGSNIILVEEGAGVKAEEARIRVLYAILDGVADTNIEI